MYNLLSVIFYIFCCRWRCWILFALLASRLILELLFLKVSLRALIALRGMIALLVFFSSLSRARFTFSLVYWFFSVAFGHIAREEKMWNGLNFILGRCLWCEIVCGNFSINIFRSLKNCLLTRSFLGSKRKIGKDKIGSSINFVANK